MLCNCRIVSPLKQSSFPTTPGASTSPKTMQKVNATYVVCMILYENEIHVLAGLCDRLLKRVHKRVFFPHLPGEGC